MIVTFLLPFFHICSSQRFVHLVSFQAYTQTFEMEGAGVRILGYS